MSRREPAWKDEPASGPQLFYLRGLRPDIPEEKLQGLTKGQASFLLDEYRKRKREDRPR